ncbi:type II toxin-antitoxin system mRNA interferase toxin, RelE/StbE family [Patescibacteria group bacterium]|nr:MAG: type II toxin-antitoxin system mRNA interferase toxin, RelE/StbE family [Patescibacteria group bacterium]
MEVSYTSRFAREAKKLPASLRSIVKDRVERFLVDPFEPTLKTHKLTGRLQEYWSFSINFRYRIIFRLIDRHHALFHSIGDHSIYD